MSSVDSYDVRDPSEARDTRSEKYSKSRKKNYSKLLRRKSNKNQKSKKAQLPIEEQYVDESDHSNSVDDGRTSMGETETLDIIEGKNLNKDEKNSKKEKYKKGVLAATEVITVILKCHGEINDETRNAVVATLLCGKETVARSPKGKKALKKATATDYSFAEMAMLAAETVIKQGGSREEMKMAAASVLACRRLKEYRDFEFKRSHLLAISYAAAKDAMKNNKKSSKRSVQFQDSETIDDDFSSKVSSKGTSCYYSEKEEDDDESLPDTITLAVTSFDSIDQIRSGGLKAWRENVKELFSYGFAEVMGCIGDHLVQASEKTTKKIEETVINDYLIQNGVETYDIVGEHATWRPWVSNSVDFVELEARFERYFFTVKTAKGTCTLELPSGKKFLKQKRKYGGRTLASTAQARAEMGI